MDSKKQLSLPAALAWIVGSTLLVTGFGYNGIKYYLKSNSTNRLGKAETVLTIVQTGPQKEALKTVYLAELMGISVDRPLLFSQLNPEEANRRLLRSPVIKEASVKGVKPGTVYVDYSVRQPIAWLYEYTNAAIDEEGAIFPVSPFFSPKKLPEVYLGIPPFSEEPWGKFLEGREARLALSLLKLFSEPAYRDLFQVRRIDVSNAFAESYGVREIVLLIEDEIALRENGKEAVFVSPRFLRLSTKNYSQELGNFLKLRPQMLEQEQKGLKMPEGEVAQSIKLPEKVIDFRLPSLAFIEERK